MSLVRGLNNDHLTGSCWSLVSTHHKSTHRFCSSAICYLVDNPVSPDKSMSGNPSFLDGKKPGKHRFQWQQRMECLSIRNHGRCCPPAHSSCGILRKKSGSGITKQWITSTIPWRSRDYSRKPFLKSQKWIYLYIYLFIFISTNKIWEHVIPWRGGYFKPVLFTVATILLFTDSKI